MCLEIGGADREFAHRDLVNDPRFASAGGAERNRGDLYPSPAPLAVQVQESEDDQVHLLP